MPEAYLVLGLLLLFFVIVPVIWLVNSGAPESSREVGGVVGGFGFILLFAAWYFFKDLLLWAAGIYVTIVIPQTFIAITKGGAFIHILFLIIGAAIAYFGIKWLIRKKYADIAAVEAERKRIREEQEAAAILKKAEENLQVPKKNRGGGRRSNKRK